MLEILRQKLLAAGAGTVAAATAYTRPVIVWLELVDRQLKAAHRQLEALCDRLADAGESAAGQGAEQCDVTILRRRELEGSSLPHCSRRPGSPCIGDREVARYAICAW
ncbi:hypothetical protein [Chelativorans xinjiangense]|uniref:hypothetical protein n=1 Tax=Chelativorans xinjiangense TaxID=2681485 RepID=UPI00135B9086|nr:hypothetical protein [Chelativorans xinjiangense]